MADVVLRGATLADGSPADVRISGERIGAVGDVVAAITRWYGR